ncbi:MAG: hypothetical protein H5U40_00005, partial [Polyangiaceae bacterium]|nr:hypothetical protein [Polyangiaceae bacterium]
SGVSAMVFVKRAFIAPDATHDVIGGSNQTIDYLRYQPGGGVFVLSPPTPDGELRNLTAAFVGVDVNGIDLSFDARRVVFSMRREGDPKYHLYLANLDGTGDVRQLTFGEHDDVKPIFVPGDRIAFVTNQPFTSMGTRADEYNHSRVVSQLATIAEATGDADRRVCSHNLSHSADPFLLSDGRIAFSRWEHLGPVNDVKLFAMNPDCSQMIAIAGQHDKPGNSLVQVAELSAGQFVGIVTSRERTIQAGAIYRIDARNLGGGSALPFDEERVTYRALTPLVPTGEQSPASGVGRYRLPRPIPGSSNYVVSWANGDVNDRNEIAATAPNFGIYMYDPGSMKRTLVYDDPRFWDLYATPVAPRAAPPIRAGIVAPSDGASYEAATIGSVDITKTSLEETVAAIGEPGPLGGLPLRDALAQATHVRIIEGFSSEIGPIGQFGLTMHEGAAIIGEATVHSDGSWAAQVPPFLPYHLQPLDRFGMSIRNQLTWIQAMPGEDRRCGGCHEGRTETILPRNGSQTVAQQVGPEDFLRPIAARTELPWSGAAAPTRNVQDVLNQWCVSCHSGGAGDPFAGQVYTVEVTSMNGTETRTYAIPVLDLSGEPMNVEYENEVVPYPRSYVSLLYPSAMMGDSEVVSGTPVEWVIPGAARESALIRAVNINAFDDPGAWAWTGGAAHHTNGELDAMPRADRMILVQMADLGGQYWSRRNVEGADSWSGVEY